jgi:hypothetical protein
MHQRKTYCRFSAVLPGGTYENFSTHAESLLLFSGVTFRFLVERLKWEHFQCAHNARNIPEFQ